MLCVQFGLPCSRLRMIEILSNFLRSVMALSPQDLLQCVYLCLNKLAPAYKGVELGIGDTVLMKAIAQATGRMSCLQCVCMCVKYIEVMQWVYYRKVLSFFEHFIIPFGEFWLPYLDMSTSAARAALPSPTSACWIFSCFRNPPNSDMDDRIFNVRMWSVLCVRIHVGVGHTDSTQFV